MSFKHNEICLKVWSYAYETIVSECESRTIHCSNIWQTYNKHTRGKDE